MALEEKSNNGGTTYLQLDYGKKSMYIYSPDEKDGYEKHTSNSGKVTYRKYVNAVTGKVTGAYFRDNNFGGTNFNLVFEDGDEKYSVQMSIDDSVFSNLARSIKNIDVSKDLRFSVYESKSKTSDKTYFGLSVPNFFFFFYFDKDQLGFSANSVASERMHYYFIAGHVFDLSGSVKLKPALLTKVVQGAPLQIDLSANFLFNDRFTLGAAYRWDAAASLLAGFQVSDSWFIGYGYDLEVTKLANYNSGSHEFFLRYELFKNYNRVVSPRFF